MNFLRTFLDSFRERAVSVRTYVSALIFGDSSISGYVVHKPFPNDDSLEENESDDEFYDAVDQRIDLVTEIKALKGGVTYYTIKAQGLTDPTSFMRFCKPNVLGIMRAETKVHI